MRSFIQFIFICCFLSIASRGSSQNLNIDSLLDKFSTNYPQEKVFLQTDRGNYFAGETMWMKAWCTIDGLPTYLSRILYIDLVNAKGDVLQKKMYKLDSLSSTPADFDLPATIPSGTYALNAYTLWMQNFPDFVFHKEIFIYGSDFKNDPKKTSAPSIKLQFFPEGGDMIAGLNNRVAFKAVSNKGLPVEVKGYISDNSGKQVAVFSSEHDGMGAFELQPEQGKEYAAYISAGNGADLQFKIPAAKNQGITLKVENNNPQKLFVLLDRSESQKEKYGKIKVVAQINHKLVYEAHLDLDQDQNAFAINKKLLPAGIIQLTAFDINNNPLAERLAFIENYEIIQPSIKPDTLNFKERANNHLSFSIPTNNKSSVAVAVTSNNIENGLSNSIASSLLLTSDIKGYVNDAAYYFETKDQVTLHHLDLLLMTQGWRRFEWKKLIAGEFPALKYPVESGIWLAGKVTKSDRSEPVKEGKVSFIIKGEDSTKILAESQLTDKGEFLLKDLVFKKKATIAYQGTNNKKENLIVDVHVTPGYIDTLTKTFRKPFVDLDTSNSDALAQYVRNNIQPDTSGKGYLGNVTVVSKRMSKEDSLNVTYTNGVFTMGKGVDPSKFQYYTTPWQILQASVPGIRVEGNPFDPNVFFTRFQGLNGISSNTGSAVSAGESSAGESFNIVIEANGIAYYLNEINVSKDVINALSVEDIALIKVLKNEAAALGATEGAIAFYTKKGVPTRSTVYEKTFTKIEKTGYAVVRQFYESDLSVKRDGADNRLTLYWNGDIKPRKDGSYHLQFVNDDLTKEFRVVVQGIDKNGKLIFTEQVIR
jgi:hypothetical protein